MWHHAGHSWTEEQLTWCRENGIKFSIQPDFACTEGFDGPRGSVFEGEAGGYDSAKRLDDKRPYRSAMTLREAILWCVGRE